MVAITLSPSPEAAEGVSWLRLVAPPRRARPGRLLGVAVLVLVLAVSVGYLLTVPALESSGPIPVQDTRHVVAEGETMWSIAGAVAPAGEAGAYVERLVAVNGSAAVEPGQVLRLPVP